MPAQSVSKPRVLFVDDEPAILDLLSLTVDSMGKDWESRFVESGERALGLLERESFDLVISDMRMPGMSGAELLNQVMSRYPATGRILLSGYADNGEVLRCIGATHQFIAKPCDLSTITATLDRMRCLRERLRSPEIQKVVGKKNALPSIPSVYFKILKVLQDPECSLEAVGAVIKTDPGLTAKLLQLVNSAFFGHARETSNITEAVMHLGLGTIRALALSTPLLSVFDDTKAGGFSSEQLLQHSVRVAQSAKRIMLLEGKEEQMAEEAFTAGILHDIGKLILAQKLGADYARIIERAAKEGRNLTQIESEVLGTTHAEVGAYLLDLWGLPPGLVEATALHDEPSQATGRVFNALTGVHVANVFENQSPNSDIARPEIGFDTLYLDQLGIVSRVEVWTSSLRFEASGR